MRFEAIARRTEWIGKLATLGGSFDVTARVLCENLQLEVATEGIDALMDHLRLCSAIPESYGHDSTEEKLYSKYTDAILAESFSAIGLQSAIIEARGDSADVQARGKSFSLVADAKAFRLSRTAKNQKDFKIQAMDGWRRTLDFAIVVCPIYQLPSKTSQIYEQAIARNVCVLSYSHLATLAAFAARRSKSKAESGLKSILQSLSAMHQSKSAYDYWTTINSALVKSLGKDVDLWHEERRSSIVALQILKEEALATLQTERDRLQRLSHRAAITELLKSAGIDSRIGTIGRVEHGNLLGENN